MQLHDAIALARLAVAASPSRPATAVIHDSPDARLVLFRISPSQSVSVHTSPSTVVLTVLSGNGFVTGGTEEREVTAGDVVTFDPKEPHGMRSATDELLLLATIAPRPGSAR